MQFIYCRQASTSVSKISDFSTIARFPRKNFRKTTSATLVFTTLYKFVMGTSAIALTASEFVANIGAIALTGVVVMTTRTAIDTAREVTTTNRSTVVTAELTGVKTQLKF
jgi:ABC-type bacteriocin/lantibiotic exporter with double-glycine peptidase domain